MSHKSDGSLVPASVFGAVLGVVVGVILSISLLMMTWPSDVTMPDGAWWLFWFVAALSAAALGATVTVALVKNSELRDLRSYVNTFVYPINHQASVDGLLTALATQVDTASKKAIDLRTNGVKWFGEGNVENLDPDRVLEKCRRIQESADNDFRNVQARFYNTFDLAAKFENVFGFKLKERKFKAYVPHVSADQVVEETKS